MNKDLKLFNSRYHQIVVIVLVLMVILAIRLFVVSVMQHDKWAEEASDQNTKTIYTAAPRGNIYDCSGRLLAGSKQTFTITFNASSLTTEQINKSALETINTLERNGDKYRDDFAIKISKSGNFYYTYDEKIKKWLRKEGFSTNLTASQAFKRLRVKYNINKNLNRYEAMDVLQEKYNLDPPIYVKKMTYTYDMEKKQFLGKFAFPESEIDKGISAKQCFKQLRDDYSIDKSLSNREARKIFIIRNEIATNGFTKYNPITIAKNVSNKTITYIEEAEVPGADVASEYQRYYPNGKTACHILGYLGAISESEVEYYVEKKGYSASDLVGKDGIESAYEEQLHGTPGIKKVRVNSSGEYVKTISETKAQKGNDIYLTINLDLQKTAEQALESGIASAGRSQSGATVAIEPKTGNVLAMASYPGYDPNIFSGGISEKAWESVQSKNPRDYLAPAPLYNNATKAAVAPGSTFKPITAMAALECGLNPYMQIYDKGYIDYGDRTYACSSWNDFGGNHGSENLEWGIGNSCNYYFFCIATGKDWGSGASLGYSEKITVDKILQMAKNFGLGQETGIELSENVLPLASAKRKMEAGRIGVWSALYDRAHTFFPAAVADDYDKLSKNLDMISGWIEDNPDYNDIISMLDKKTDVKKNQLENVAAMIKFDYFIQAQWTTGDQFNISIGQGDNAYTPLQMANYVATLGNNGVRHKVNIVMGIENQGITDPVVAKKIKLKSTTIPEVIKGMKRVCSSGTLSGVFGYFPVEVAGKTGTAENQNIRQPASEVKYVKEHLSSLNSRAGTSVSWAKVVDTMNKMMEDAPDRYPSKDDTIDEALIKASKYKISQAMIDAYKGSYDYYAWTVAMAPADEPKIAVSAMLIEGGYSSNAAPITKKIISRYLDLNNNRKGDYIKNRNTGKNVVQ